MEIKLALALPRDEFSVPVARRILARSLDVLGVDETVVADIELALTEACTNVLDHANDTDDYEVSVGIDGTICIIEVIDRGAGFDGDSKGRDVADPDAEDGRGIALMRSLVDEVTFTSRPQVGTVVHLEKQLAFGDDSVLKRLTDEQPERSHELWPDAPSDAPSDAAHDGRAV